MTTTKRDIKRRFGLLLMVVSAIALLMLIFPWVLSGLDAYGDWVYCATHDKPAKIVSGMTNSDYFYWRVRCDQ